MNRRAWLSASTLVAIAAAWSIAAERPALLILRELYRLGETVGITPTPPAPGARLAGQILGFNYSQPPGWYALCAQTLAVALALCPLLVPTLILHLQLNAPRNYRVRRPHILFLRAVLATLAAGLVFASLQLKLNYWLWSQFLALGESLGGSVARLSGQVGITSRGPFYGDTFADSLGNLLVRYGPNIAFTALAAITALVTHRFLWRTDLRRAADPTRCTNCAYDLGQLPPAAPCPECGEPRPTPVGHECAP